MCIVVVVPMEVVVGGGVGIDVVVVMHALMHAIWLRYETKIFVRHPLGHLPR